MHRILVIGAGKIGSLIAFLLSRSSNYEVHLIDKQKKTIFSSTFIPSAQLKISTLDVSNTQTLRNYLNTHAIDAIISCLPFYANLAIARIAAAHHLHYFDLTEDTKTTEAITQLATTATTNAFVPQCGLAPGFISLVTHDLMKLLDTIDTVKMRVGALPISSSNALHYSLTWSTEGLINEYANLCEVIEDGHLIQVLPLENIEEITIDGLSYEAFNTSGGIGSLAKTYVNKVKQLNYKTIRYPGHCAKIKFLLNDLKLNEDRDTLKRILEHAIPFTSEDVVLIYVSVTGMQNNQFIEHNYIKKFYSQTIEAQHWSAIQLTTASAACAIADIVLEHPEKYCGWIQHERFSFNEFTQNTFGQYFLAN